MATPSSLAVSSGGGQVVFVSQMYGSGIRVLAVDTLGYAMPNEPVVFSLPASGPSGFFAWSQTRTCTVHTDANGYATSEQIVANTTPGDWTGLVQFVNALGISTTYGGRILPTTPIAYTMTIVSGGNQKGAQNAAYSPLVVRVLDQYGNPFVGAYVPFSSTAGYGSFGAGNVYTDAAGLATSNTFTSSSTVGSFTVTASTQGSYFPDPTSTTTWTTVNATLPTSLSVISGSNQKANPSALFANALVARVYNGLGAPLAGISVTFTAPTSGASCTFVGAATTQVVTSDASGYATSAVPKANATTNTYPYYVVASASGATDAKFSLVNGLTYLPEVCTAYTAPTVSENILASGVTDWSNPTRAINGNTTGTQLGTVYNEESRRLLVRDLPASAFAEIDNLAKITKFQAKFEFRKNTGTNQPNCQHVGSSATQNITGLINNTYVAQTLVFTAQANITGAMLKAGGYGLYINSVTYTNPLPVFACRYVTLSVCYQNPEPAAGAVASSSPLLTCEA